LSLMSAGCSGRVVHSDLALDQEILQREWTLRTREVFKGGDRGGDHSNVVLYENTIIFGNESVGVVSMYPGLGQVRWVLPIKEGVRSEISAVGAAVYFAAGDGFLYSVDAESGRVRWRYPIRTTLASKPTLAGGRLFVTTADDTVYAFDAGSGQWLWHYRRRSNQPATILGAAAPLVVGKNLIAGLSDGYIVALGTSDGKLKWERRLGDTGRFVDVDAQPVKRGKLLYVPAYDGAFHAVRASDGKIIWKFDGGGSRSPTISGKRIYLPSSDGFVYALGMNGGKPLWEFELDAGVPTGVVVTKKYVIFGSSHQYLYVLDKATGKAIYRMNAGYGSGFHSNPVLDKKNRLFVLSSAGNLYTFSVRRDTNS